MRNSIFILVLYIFFLKNLVIASYISPSEAYKAAIENSTKIASSKYQFNIKEENLEELYAKLYPQIDGSVSLSRTDYKRNELINSRDPYVKEESTDLNISFNQVIFDPILFSKIDVEKSKIKLYSYDLEIAKQKLTTETLDIYMKVLNSKNKILLLKTNLAYIEQNIKMIEEKYSMNLVTKMDYLKVKVEYQKAKISLLQEEKNYEITLNKLKDITKLKTITIPNINLDSLSEEFLNKILNVVNNNLNINKNLAILQSKSAIEISNLEIKNAKSENLPSLGFNATYTEYISEDITSDYENFGKLMLRLKIPIFEGGATSSKIRSKQLAKKAALEDFKTAEDTTLIKLDENVNKLKFQINTIKVYKEALISGQTYLSSIQLAYDNGLKSIVELYDAKNKLFEIEYEYINAINEMANLYVEFLILTNNLDRLDLIDILVDINHK